MFLFSKRVWGLLGLGVVGGIVLLAAFNAFTRYTNTLSFCTSCHEMDLVTEEYKKTSHYQNKSGVQAVCADCHVPKEVFPKLIRKVYATKDLIHHFLGTVDTPEKFEAARLKYAQRVWRQMEANDSHECRNCHSFSAMELSQQTPRARVQHEDAVAEKQTCIDCHKGIAHKPVHEELKKESGEEGGAPAETTDFML